MNHKLAMQRLYWKEFRQLAPLVALLIAMGLILHLVYLVSTRNVTQWTPPWLIYLGLPGIFAAGTGALLIGQEKEMRTIGWLSSLPIAPRDILRAKLTVAFAGLCIVWFFSLLLPLLTGSWREFEFEWIWPVHSLFVLLLGFATAWYFNSSLISLLIVIPLACLPIVTAELVKLIASLITGRPQQFGLDTSSETWLNLCSSVLFGLVAGWAGWRLGERFFVPAVAPGVSPKSRNREQRSDQQIARLRTRWNPFSALVWQAATQSRVELIIALNMAVITALTSLIPMAEGLHAMIATVAAFIGATLLGVSVFQGDSIQDRVRFLADRGVGATQAWFSRQMVPASLLALSVLLIACLLLNYRTSDRVGGLQALLPLVFILIAIVLATYAASQWVALLTRSPIVAVVAAVLFSLTTVGYILFAINELGSPWWLVGSVVLIPFIATYTMTRRWMDRDLGLGFWLTHASLLVLAVTIPASSLLIVLAQSDSMPSALRSQFEHDVVGYQAFKMQPRELQVPRSKDPNLFVSNLKTQLEIYMGPVRFDQNLLLLLSNAELDRVRLGEIDSDSGKEEALQKRFQTEISLLHELVARYRLSPRLLEQDTADQVERWLQFVVYQKGAEETFGRELHADLKQQLENVVAREEAIRRAIVLSWDESIRSVVRNGSMVDFGGYSLPVASGQLTLVEVVKIRRFASQQAELLWKYFNSESIDDQSRLRIELAKAWNRPVTEFNREMQSLDDKGAVSERPLMTSLFNFRLPGRAWHVSN